MKAPVLLSDLAIISTIFFDTKSGLLIFDPEGFLQKDSSTVESISCRSKKALYKFCHQITIDFFLINLSDEVLPPAEFSKHLRGIIDFSGQTFPQAKRHYYINNPDGAMRWFFPSKTTTASFLSLYNSTGVKAYCFKQLAKILSRIRCLSLLSAGSFAIWESAGTNKKNWQTELSFDDYAIFTGTVGENRKAIIALHQEQNCTHFLKIPLTKAARALTQNEAKQLAYLTRLKLQTIQVPSSQKIADTLLVSNVKTQGARNQLAWTNVHSKALAELYHLTVKREILRNLETWKELEASVRGLQAIEKIENNLPPQKLRYLTRLCHNQLQSIPPTERLSVGMAHGDFTPWNMYQSAEKLLVYDWEMSQMEMPLFFDVFHYIFQKGILIERKTQIAIEEEIEAIMEGGVLKDLQGTYQVNWQLHYALYLIFIVSYYLPKYAIQPRLHLQVHWLLEHWTQALEKITTPSRMTSKVKKHCVVKSQIIVETSENDN
ncbi:MAG: hypothetical protein AB8G15_19345 [Saprospiraceae bacterium]